jgi:FkbM family methyltransferase
MSKIQELNQPIILYGAGYCGAMFLTLLRNINKEPVCFFDKNERKIGKDVFEIPVRKPAPWDTIGGEVEPLVIVCVLDNQRVYPVICTDLRKMGYHNIIHLFDLRENRELFQPLSYMIIYPEREKILKNKVTLDEVSALLCDSLSRQTLDAILDFLMCDSNTQIPAFSLQEQYWDYRIYKPIDNETCIDCGAFNGTVMEQFIAGNPQYIRYIAFEPDPANSSRIEDVCSRRNDGRIDVYGLALGDRHEEVYLKNFMNENSVIVPDGNIKAKCVCLDDYLDQFAPTLIKIDTEGWEKKILTGASRTIQQYKPLIAIAVYHHVEDFWELPLMIHQLLPEHKLYLRSYMNVSETILYAVPVNRMAECLESA